MTEREKNGENVRERDGNGARERERESEREREIERERERGFGFTVWDSHSSASICAAFPGVGSPGI